MRCFSLRLVFPNIDWKSPLTVKALDETPCDFTLRCVGCLREYVVIVDTVKNNSSSYWVTK